MAAAVSATYNCHLTVNETIALGLDDVSDPAVTHDIGDTKDTLTATSTVKATKAWSDTATLSAGAATIDLTSLANGNLPTVTFSGLKVKVVKIICPTGNTEPIVFAVGAANPYDLFGTASDRISVSPGNALVFYFADELENVDATHCEIDLSSADQDAAYSIIIVAGGT